MAALTSRFNREWEQEEGRCCLCYDCHRQIYKATVAILQSKVQEMTLLDSLLDKQFKHL